MGPDFGRTANPFKLISFFDFCKRSGEDKLAPGSFFEEKKRERRMRKERKKLWKECFFKKVPVIRSIVGTIVIWKGKKIKRREK